MTADLLHGWLGDCTSSSMVLGAVAEGIANKSETPKILVVDDQPDVREALRLLLKGQGYAIETAASPDDALAAAAYGDYDLIVADMNFSWDTTSGEEGLRLVDRLHAQQRDVRVIAMTGWSTIELAVQAMQRGACDFIPKPWDNGRFISVVQKHLNSPPAPKLPLDADLALARKVQRKLLPQPHFSAMDSTASAPPCRPVRSAGICTTFSRSTRAGWLFCWAM